MRDASLLGFPALLVLSLVAVGCECSPPPRSRTCETQRDCRSGEMCIDGECTARVDASMPPGTDAGPGLDAGPPRTIESVRIEPAASTLVSVDGSMPMETFRAIVVYSDATEGPAVGPSFTIDTVSLGDLDEASGAFSASGLIGGSATVSVTVPDPRGGSLMATASLVVRLERTVRGDGITDDDVARFGTAPPVDDAARTSGVVYPLDGVVMPQNVYPADVQWTRSAAGDLFRVTLAKPSATLVAYLVHDPAMHWLVDEAAWRAIAQSDPDAAATLTVDRIDASTGELVRDTPRSITFARAALTGSIYYWAIERGRIVRIDDGTATRNEFMPNPQLGCVGCHSVSNSGRYMAGRLGGGENTGTVYDLTTDLTGNPPPTVFPVGALNWWFSSWSPDDTRLVVSFQDDGPRTMRIYDPFAGTVVPITGTLPSNATHPAWSPDGTRIAYVSDANAWGGTFTAGSISVLPVTAPDTVGSPTIIHAGTSLPDGVADSYPTWSPDSSHIAFAHGTGCRSESHNAALYLMASDGSAVTHLATASSAARLDYQPRFSPFVQGGYYWLSFLSRRDYGNAPRGNVTRPAHLRQQIWVAAIRMGVPAGTDPSAVPYWLPGQDPLAANISAFWAPRACRPDGEECSVGSECCGGDCRPPAGGGAPVCSPPPPERCRRSGETCSTDADCCPDMGLTCLGNVCVAGPG